MENYKIGTPGKLVDFVFIQKSGNAVVILCCGSKCCYKISDLPAMAFGVIY